MSPSSALCSAQPSTLMAPHTSSLMWTGTATAARTSQWSLPCMASPGIPGTHRPPFAKSDQKNLHPNSSDPYKQNKLIIMPYCFCKNRDFDEVARALVRFCKHRTPHTLTSFSCKAFLFPSVLGFHNSHWFCGIRRFSIGANLLSQFPIGAFFVFHWEQNSTFLLQTERVLKCIIYILYL